jgi:hypothetical protein
MGESGIDPTVTGTGKGQLAPIEVWQAALIGEKTLVGRAFQESQGREIGLICRQGGQHRLFEAARGDQPHRPPVRQIGQRRYH